MMATPTLAQWRTMSFTLRPPAHLMVEQAIRDFLRACPNILSHSTELDNQNHGSNEIHGTIVLPLWQQTPEFNHTRPHWNTFIALIETISLVMESTATTTCLRIPDEFNKAMQVWNTRRNQIPPGQAIQPRELTSMICFETVRLTVNLAPAFVCPSTSHPSQWVVSEVVGNFTGGDLIWHVSGAQRTRLQPGDLYATKTALRRSVMPFVSERRGSDTGQRYQLEFFFPDTSAV